MPTLQQRDTSALTAIGAVRALFGAPLWAYIGALVVSWCYERLFGGSGFATGCYRLLRGEFGGRRTSRP